MSRKIRHRASSPTDSSASAPSLLTVERTQTLTLGEVLTLAHLRFRANASEQIEIQAFGGEEQALVRFNVTRFKRLVRGLFFMAAGSLSCGGILTLTAGVRTREQLLEISPHFSASSSHAMISIQFVVGKSYREGVNLREYRNSDAFQRRLEQIGYEAAELGAVVQTTVRGKWTMDTHLFIPCTLAPPEFSLPQEGREELPKATPRYVLSGSETVLIVDDDPRLRTAARRVLEHAGYTVLEAQDGFEAETKLVELEGDVDLVLLDLSMPGKHGGQVFYEMRQVFPEIAVLLSSGDAHNPDLRHLLLTERLDFIGKPYAPNELLSSVRRALNRIG